MDGLHEVVAARPRGGRIALANAAQIHEQAKNDLRGVMRVAGDLANHLGLQVFGRAKSPESILTKWERKGHDHPIHDATAITIEIRPETFREEIQWILHGLSRHGHKPIGDLSNYHVAGTRDNRFQQRMLSQATGRIWELQFRFAESMAVDNHREFEIARDPQIPIYVAQRAELRARNIAAQVVLPPEVLDLGVVRPFQSVVRH